MPHANHHSFFHYFLNRELSEIYITVALKSFALALIAIFIPIYLFQKGFSLNEIFLFFAILSAAFAFFSFFATKLSTKIGIKHSILISMPFLIAFYFMLQFISLKGFFYLTPIIGGIHGSMFWINYHLDFARFSSKKIRTQQISGCMILSLILAVLGPVIGGLILLYLNFNFLFILVSVILLIATIPLFMSKETYIHKSFSFKQIKIVLKKLGPKGIIGFVGFGMTLASALIWPLFMFMIIKTYLNVGALTTVALFTGIISTFFVGKLSDKFGKDKILGMGSFLSSIMWFIIIFVKTTFHILGINIFLGITAPASGGGPAFDAINYDIAKRKHIAEIIFIRETTIRASLTLLLLFFFFFANLKLVFIFGAIGSLFILIFSSLKKKI